MANYVVLMNWTDQGVKNAKDTVNRFHDASKMVESLGAKIQSIYWTSGGYDLVTIVEAPDDETLAAVLLTIGAGGNLRTQTLRAFDEKAMAAIISKLP
ncbi:GYD domain-containing protein [soil metagenome]